MVPSTLRTWFTLHFIIDFIVAIPLFIAPLWFMGLFGFTTVDPLTARLVAGALFGIGGVSMLVRNKSQEVYEALLVLKIIWSLSAIVGIALSILEGAPKSAFIFLVIFAGFSFVWMVFFKRLKRG